MAFHNKEGARRWAREVDRPLRRARLLAAREYRAGGVVRRGILSGHWDGGNVVRKYLEREERDGR